MSPISESHNNINSPEDIVDNLEYGTHIIKEKIEFRLPHNTIILERIGKNKFLYRRINTGTIVEKLISIRTPNLEIEFVPTHPLYKPSYKTDYMFLRLTQPVFVSRNSVTDIFVTIPIEIGLYFTGNKIREHFDVFSCEPAYSRYALYGDPEQGMICKYAKVIPQTLEDKFIPYVHARLKIIIDNELDTGITLGKIVFPMSDHDIYYNHLDAVYDNLKIEVKEKLGIKIVDIIQQNETGPKDWSKSSRIMRMTDVKFTMENGFD